MGGGSVWRGLGWDIKEGSPEYRRISTWSEKQKNHNRRTNTCNKKKVSICLRGKGRTS